MGKNKEKQQQKEQNVKEEKKQKEQEKIDEKTSYEKLIELFVENHNILEKIVEEFYTPIKDEFEEELPKSNKYKNKLKRIFSYYFLNTYLYFETKRFLNKNSEVQFNEKDYSRIKKNSLEYLRKKCYFEIFTKTATIKDKKNADNFNQAFKDYYKSVEIEKC